MVFQPAVGHTLVTSKSDEWFTPSSVIEDARKVLGVIDLDPASCDQANETVKATRYFTKENDGLAQEWHGRVWLNPPYGKLASLFTAKFLEEYREGRLIAGLILVNSNALGAKWGQQLWDCDLICCPEKRIKFLDPDGKSSSSTHGSLIGYVGAEKESFIEVFSDYGRIVKRHASIQAIP